MRKLLTLIAVTFSLMANAQTVDTWLGARMNGAKLLDNSNIVQFWGYGNYTPGIWTISLPAPLLEYTLGDTVQIHFINDSPEDHTIHLHGLDVPTIHDGVPATSFAVHAGDTAHYTFIASHTGSFLYHCHVLTTLHLTMGMYGMIVVHPDANQNTVFPGGPSYQLDYNFLNSDMDESINTNPLSPGPFNEFTCDYFMVNGLSGNQLYNSVPNHVIAYSGDSVLLRIGSMAYTKSIYYFPPELNAKAYTSDGRVLPNAFDCDTLVVHSGERFGVLLTPTADVNADIRVESVEMRNNQVQHTNLIRLNTDLGFDSKPETELSFYPNPTNGLLYFIAEKPGSMIQVYNLNGLLVFEDIAGNTNTLLNLSFLDNGAYILRYQSESYKIMLQK